MIKDIGIWGQYGAPGEKIADGQAVRTTVITQELEDKYGKENINIVNTNNWKSHPIKFLLKSISLIKNSKSILILPADRGFKVFAPILVFFNTFFKRKLVYIVIGGFLPGLLEKKKQYIRIVKKMDILFVQTENLRKDLKKFGIENISILSNLKRLKSRKVEEITLNKEEVIEVCTFSRVNKEKGIEDAIEAVRLTNEVLKGNKIKLDIYGLLPKEYEERFKQILKDNESFVKYKGIVPFDKTVDTLKKYFALIFPTYYYGEGFPGNVIDAYNTGIPIVATKWLYNMEVIRDGRNGILVPIKSPQNISKAILELYNDREKTLEISLNNINDAKMYNPDYVLKDLYKFLDDNIKK